MGHPCQSSRGPLPEAGPVADVVPAAGAVAFCAELIELGGRSSSALTRSATVGFSCCDARFDDREGLVVAVRRSGGERFGNGGPSTIQRTNNFEQGKTAMTTTSPLHSILDATSDNRVQIRAGDGDPGDLTDIAMAHRAWPTWS